ncbi:TetR/AcrR family transcriptional regulator [Hymenobacter latericus]|uniref:TetR/AcrR family transcriptional regulator n=1 Tax=Hymenobacter sp. YIM 151858-1 TaxID=2987688 RepID=UPI0022267F55|nr:TetR/AcrR family transcriptional regulator [Hymenobacter sp. YIM 151858-1]UYZ58331.1 TetR/AcrR family transcriptional regulator [Hymenobacter sp. YIM 151858-1]
MSRTLRDTLLEEANQLFRREGIESQSQEQIIAALDVSPVTFREMFADKADLVMQTLQYDIDRQKREHAELFALVQNPVGRLLSLLELGIRDLRDISPTYFADLIQHYPQVWEAAQQHLATYSFPQISGILNDGVLQKLLRGDINIGLVTKIILEQLNMVLNEQIFPPTRYNVAEVFRSVYLYYFRGLCTDEGIRAAGAYFARM